MTAGNVLGCAMRLLRVPVWYEIVMWGISAQRAGVRCRGQGWSSIMWRSNRCKWWASWHGIPAKPLLIESHVVAWAAAVMWGCCVK